MRLALSPSLSPFLPPDLTLYLLRAAEVDIGAWKPANGACEERDLTYLKPLNAPVGPKQTHCLIHDLNEQRDDDSVIVNLTSTKTPVRRCFPSLPRPSSSFRGPDRD